MLTNLKDWQLKYIELKSKFYDVPSDIECAKLLNISRQSIYNFKRDCPEYKKLIRDNLVRLGHEIGIEAIQALIKGIRKGNPKLIEIGLEIDSIYKKSQTIHNEYEGMKSDDLAVDVHNSLKRLLGKNGVIYKENKDKGE